MGNKTMPRLKGFDYKRPYFYAAINLSCLREYRVARFAGLEGN